MDWAPGDGAELMGVGGWDDGCCCMGAGGPPCGLGVPGWSSPEAGRKEGDEYPTRRAYAQSIPIKQFYKTYGRVS